MMVVTTLAVEVVAQRQSVRRLLPQDQVVVLVLSQVLQDPPSHLVAAVEVALVQIHYGLLVWVALLSVATVTKHRRVE
jgi:uncharacterized membrane protein YcaP (DUF421 family)